MSDHRYRVLFLNHTARFGGAEEGLAGLVGDLRRRGVGVVAAVPGPGVLTDRLSAAGARVVDAPLLRFKRSSNPARLTLYVVSVVAVARRLARLIAAERIDLVHANSTSAQFYGGPAARRAGVPSVWHCRDLAPLDRASVWMARGAARVVAVSRAVADALAAGGWRGPCEVIHNGVDTERFRPRGRRIEARQALDLPEEAFAVAMIAHLVPWKRHDLFIRAAARVGAQAPAARFIVFGGDLFGEHAAYRRGLAAEASRLGLGGRLTFAGPRDDLDLLLEGVDAVLHPTDREPFGRALAEAMAVGRPVVAVNACGPAEIVTDGTDGLLVPPGDVEAMAAKTLLLARDAAMARRLGEEARRTVERRFTVAHCAGRVLDLHARLLSALDGRPLPGGPAR